MIIENWEAGRKSSSVTILDQWVDPEKTTRLTQGAQKGVITVAARLTWPHIE